jgi:hypothetical protein
VRRNRRLAVLSVVTLIALPVVWARSSPQTPRTAAAVDAAKRVVDSDRRQSVPLAVGNVYAHTGVGQFVPATRHVPYLLYVPESAGTGVDVVDPGAL